MGALDYSLPVGLPVFGAGIGAVTNLVGTTQSDVSLGSWRLTCVNSGTDVVQQDTALTDFRIANQSVMCSAGTGFPSAAMAFNTHTQDEIIGVSLAAGTQVTMQVTGGAAAYDVGASIATDPIADANLAPGQAPGDFDLDSIALLYPLNPTIIVAGATTVMAAVCNRTCKLGKLFLTHDNPASYCVVTSVLIGGVEQLAQSTTGGIPLQHFFPTSTFQAEYMDFNQIITPGEQVQISILELAGVVSNALGGFYCLPI